MFQKKYAVISVVAVYLLLFVFFFKLQKKKEYLFFRIECFDSPCVRFCCNDEKYCDDNYINNNFNKSLIPDDEYFTWNASKSLRIFKGSPKCNGWLKGVENKEWKFDNVI